MIILGKIMPWSKPVIKVLQEHTYRMLPCTCILFMRVYKIVCVIFLRPWIRWLVTFDPE